MLLLMPYWKEKSRMEEEKKREKLKNGYAAVPGPAGRKRGRERERKYEKRIERRRKVRITYCCC